MAADPTMSPAAVLLDDEAAFDLARLAQACGAEPGDLLVLVEEGVLQASGPADDRWHFGAPALPRARRALRLQRELALDAAALALVLDLLDRIERLEARLRHFEHADAGDADDAAQG